MIQAQAGPVILPLLGSFFAPPSANLTPIVFPEVSVQITSQRNYYQYVGETYGIFFQVITALWALVNFVSAAIFIYAQLTRRRAEFPLLAVVSLSLECLCNVLRFSINVVDPLLVWGIYWPLYIIQIWQSYFFSLSLIATFLIAFFWFRLSFHMGRKLKVGKPAVFVPILVISIMILAIEFAPLMIVIFSPFYVGDTLTGRIIAQSICYWIISAFFIISGIRIMTLIRRGRKMQYRKDERQKSMATFIIVDACLLTSFGCFIYAYTSPLAQTTNMWYGLTTMQCFWLLAISSVQIFVFAAKPSRSSDDSNPTGTDAGSTSATASGAGNNAERDSDGYMKADMSCCGRKVKSTNSRDVGNSGNTIDADNLRDSNVVDGVVEI